MPFSIIKGNLLKCDADAIVQQTNCLTTRSHGLSATIKKEFGIDPYSIRESSDLPNVAIKDDRDNPGTIQVFDTGIKPKWVVCIFGQYQPGTPNKYQKFSRVAKDDGIDETYQLREIWFETGLNFTRQWILENDIKSIAFPYKIGCGLARGNWKTYEKMIKNFYEDINEVAKVDVSIIQL